MAKHLFPHPLLTQHFDTSLYFHNKLGLFFLERIHGSLKTKFLNKHLLPRANFFIFKVFNIFHVPCQYRMISSSDNSNKKFNSEILPSPF